MTRDDVKQWMAEAGAGRTDPLPLGPGIYERFVDIFVAVAEKAAAAEREACASMVDHILKEGGGTYGDAIRAGSQS